jgi:hypothetical protein
MARLDYIEHALILLKQKPVLLDPVPPAISERQLSGKLNGRYGLHCACRPTVAERPDRKPAEASSL